MLASVLHRLDSISQALAKTDRNQHVFLRQHFDFVLQAAAGADRSFRVETKRQQSIRKVIRKRSRKVETDHQHVARAFDRAR